MADFSSVILLPFDRAGKAQIELIKATQQARVDKAEQVPQLAQMVFQWRTGGHHAEIPFQCHHRLRALGGAILDGLRFVQYNRLPLDLSQ